VENITNKFLKRDLKVHFLIITGFLIFWGIVSSKAQVISSAKTGTPMGYRVENGDTVYYSHIPEVVVRAPRKFKSQAEERQYWRLVYNVKKVYPYAKLAGQKLHELNEQYLTIRTERERKAYSKKAEDDLKAEFEGELRKLTVTQGRILMRLVDRETGNTTYEILKDFRGSASALFWQAIARVFGSNLKTQYNPSSGEDKTIEQIIMQIEEGSI
jgi:hypothetical protein